MEQLWHCLYIVPYLWHERTAIFQLRNRVKLWLVWLGQDGWDGTRRASTYGLLVPSIFSCSDALCWRCSARITAWKYISITMPTSTWRYDRQKYILTNLPASTWRYNRQKYILTNLPTSTCRRYNRQKYISITPNQHQLHLPAHWGCCVARAPAWPGSAAPVPTCSLGLLCSTCASLTRQRSTSSYLLTGAVV